MLKFLIVGTASFALIGSAVAADLPRAQPVYKEAQVGKAPIANANWQNSDRQNPSRQSPHRHKGLRLHNAVPRFHLMESAGRVLHVRKLAFYRR